MNDASRLFDPSVDSNCIRQLVVTASPTGIFFNWYIPYCITTEEDRRCVVEMFG